MKKKQFTNLLIFLVGAVLPIIAAVLYDESVSGESVFIIQYLSYVIVFLISVYLLSRVIGQNKNKEIKRSSFIIYGILSSLMILYSVIAFILQFSLRNGIGF